MSTVYKIRRKSDGLFSSGGNRPNWNEKGKAWRELAHAKSATHLGDWGYKYNGKSHSYENCEIVEYELRVKSVIKIELPPRGRRT